MLIARPPPTPSKKWDGGLPDLRAARDSTDAEVRVRAGELITRIEAELLVRPTSVRLDFEDAAAA